MAHLSGPAIARHDSAEEQIQPREKSQDKSQLEKTRCEIEDRIDFSAVRHARKLAALRGEKPMAWEAFKRKLR